MSGIVGIYHYDHCQVHFEKLLEMCFAIAHRGPKGISALCSGKVGFGHCKSHEAIFSLKETIPFIDHSSKMAITADARIDNREELAELLSIRNHKIRALSDPEIILNAYRKWGADCPEKLVGDFAFAIWDERENRLFCARDHLGIRPFFYYTSSKLFSFSSEIKSLFKLPECHKSINDQKIGEFLLATTLENSTTFFKKIFRLPPATSLIIQNDNLSLHKYWVPDEEFELRLTNVNEYKERFIKLLTEAVRCRLPTDKKIATALSGGLDSSAIACLSSKLIEGKDSKLYAVSARFSLTKECDESKYIDIILAKYQTLIPITVDGDKSGPFAELERLAWPPDEPYSTPQFYLFSCIYRSIANSGISFLIDGHDGDSAVSHGFGILDELAMESRWLTFLKVLEGVYYYDKISRSRALRLYCQRYLVQPFLVRHPTIRKYGKNLKSILSGRIHKRDERKNLGHILADSIFNAKLMERHKTWKDLYGRNTRKSERQQHSLRITSPFMIHANETQNELAARFGIELLHPFMDIRLIKYCISLPVMLKLSNGYTRYILRQSLANIVPEEVRLREHKTTLSSVFSNALMIRERSKLKKCLTNESDTVTRYVDIERVNNLLELKLTKDSLDRFVVIPCWKVAALVVWLKTI